MPQCTGRKYLLGKQIKESNCSVLWGLLKIKAFSSPFLWKKTWFHKMQTIYEKPYIKLLIKQKCYVKSICSYHKLLNSQNPSHRGWCQMSRGKKKRRKKARKTREKESNYPSQKDFPARAQTSHWLCRVWVRCGSTALLHLFLITITITARLVFFFFFAWLKSNCLCSTWLKLRYSNRTSSSHLTLWCFVEPWVPRLTPGNSLFIL